MPVSKVSKDDQLVRIEADKTALTKFWNDRNTQLTIDRETINIIKEPENTDEKQKKWYTNEPKVFFDTSRALVSLNAPRFRLPMDINPEADQKEKMNKAERLCIGIFRMLDQQMLHRGHTSWLYDLAYYVLLGWWAVYEMVEKGMDGETRFRADLWDPMTVYPEWDDSGLKKCVRNYEVDYMTAGMMLSNFKEQGLEFENKDLPEEGNVNVINWWFRDFKGKKARVWNAIVVNGILVKEITLQTKMKKIPIQIGSVGSPDTQTPGSQVRRGEAIIYANRDMYKYRNTMISLWAAILASQAYPNIIEKTRTGQPAHKGEEFKGHGSKLTYKIGDQVDLLRNATTPQEAENLMNWTGRKVDEGSLPPTVYGGAPFELSGFAISQYMATLKYKLGPYLTAMTNIISLMMTDFMLQYKEGKFPELTLSTEKPSDIRRGMTFMEDFSPDDVPERVFVEVNIPITSQFDKTQMILNARSALESPQVFSRRTIWEMGDEIQDFEIEMERINEDLVEQDPFVISMKIVSGLWQRYQALKAKGDTLAAEALRRYILLKELEIGMRQGIPEQTNAPRGGGRSSPGNPAEARNSPDVRNAIQGNPPGGLRRRPQTADERNQKRTDRARLVSPTGTPLL